MPKSDPSSRSFKKNSHSEGQSEVLHQVVDYPKEKAPVLTASNLSSRGITSSMLLKLKNSGDLSKRQEEQTVQRTERAKLALYFETSPRYTPAAALTALQTSLARVTC